MKKIVLIYICISLCGCHFFSDSRSSLEFNLDEFYQHQLQKVHIIFGSEKRWTYELNPGESFSVMFYPVSIGSHLDFTYDIGNTRHYWASWDSELFGKTFADKFFKHHHRYQIIIDLKPDNTIFLRVFLKEGLFSKKLILEGHDIIHHKGLIEEDGPD